MTQRETIINAKCTRLAPTPYPDVNALLSDLLESVRAILGPHFVGMLLFGSLVSGDFDEASDVDVLVVTDDNISDDLFSLLQAMHDRIARGESTWATQIEVSYLPRAALRRYDPAHNRHPRLDRGRGERLHMMEHEADWVVQRHLLRERGLALAGPPPQTLIDLVSPDDLRAAMLPALRLWGRSLLDDPSQMSQRGYQSFSVLSICRILYTLQHGAVVSKQTAARWALATWDRRWARLIERALEGRHDPGSPAQAEDVQGTLGLIRGTLDGTVSFATERSS
jgi:predicted nucleotidyltransferase